MKKIIFILLVISLALSLQGQTYYQMDNSAGNRMSGGCYLCESKDVNTFVKYSGIDTAKKRKKAKEQFNCIVIDSFPRCNNSSYSKILGVIQD